MSIIRNAKTRKILKNFIFLETKYMFKDNIQYFDKSGKRTWNKEDFYTEVHANNFEFLTIKWSTPQNTKYYDTVIIQFPLQPVDDVWNDLKSRNHYIRGNDVKDYNIFKNFNFNSGIIINWGKISVFNYDSINLELSISIPENKILELERQKKLEKLLC